MTALFTLFSSILCHRQATTAVRYTPFCLTDRPLFFEVGGGGWGEFWDITFFSPSGLFCFGRQKPVKGLFNKKEIGPGWWEAFDQFFPMTLKCRNFLLEIAQPHFPPSQKHDGLMIHPCWHSSRIGCAVLWF